MISSSLYADLAADRQRNLIAAADAHRVARLARLRCRTQPCEPSTQHNVRRFVRSVVASLHA